MAFPELHGVVQQVAHHAAQGLHAGVQGRQGGRVGVQANVVAGVLRIADQGVEQGRQVHRAGHFLVGMGAAGIGQAFGHQRAHAIEVGQQARAQLGIGHLFGAQAHAGQRRLQVVRDGGQQLGALLHMGLHAGLQGLQGARGLGHFGGQGVGRA